MKPIFLPLTLISFLCGNQGFAMQDFNTEQFDQEAKTFSPKQRSVELQNEINQTFQKFQRKQDLNLWAFKGAKSYYGYLDQMKLVETLIMNHSDKNKPLYFMDIGAGDFKWGFTISKLINDNNLLNPAQKIHIISLSGENLVGPEIVEDRNCKLYNFSSFPIDNLQDELEKKFPNEDIHFQLIMTR